MATPTGVLFNDPRCKPISTASLQQANATLEFYLTGTLTPTNVYSDGFLTVPMTQPVEADAAGRFPAIYLDPSVIYREQMYDQFANQLEDVDPYVPVSLGGINAALIGPIMNPISAAEIAAGVTPRPQDQIYPVGHILRYNPVLDGSTNDTAAIQSWASVGGTLIWPIAQLGLITQPITLKSNTTIQFAQGGGLTTATHDIAFMQATGQSNIDIYGGTFVQTSAGLLGQYLIAGIVFSSCNNCIAEDNNFIGMQWAGVLLLGVTQYCTVRSNYMSAALGSLQDSSDISIISNVTGAPAYCLIEDNFCYGVTNEHGIACWNPYAGPSMPSRNTIRDNKIGTHQGFGILIYSGASATDSFNEIRGNVIEGILGTFAGNPSSGAGIYCVGASAGGTIIANNVVRNCCIGTSLTAPSLAPAGIGISGTSAGSMPILIEGNTIEGMTQLFGILVTGAQGGVNVTGNTVRMPAVNVTGDAIRVANSSYVNVTANTINQLNTTTAQRCILLFATGGNVQYCSVSNNTIQGGFVSQIELAQASGQCTGITIADNIMNGGTSACIPLLLGNLSANFVMVTGNIASASGAPAVQQTACQNVRYSNNTFSSSGTVYLNFLSTNTGSFYDKLNIQNAPGTIGVNNAGTGLNIEMFFNAFPTTGTWTIGDRIEQSVSVSGQPKGWRCTAVSPAGSGSTWTSEGNL